MSSLFEFLLLVAIYIPCVALFVNIMFLPVKRLAKELDMRRESDLTPVTGHTLPSELDVFIDSINRLFNKTAGALQNERRFIADAAHEMRTPLTAISLQAQALKEDILPQDEADKVHQLKLAISRQRKLTNDLLAYARSQCGRELHFTNFDVKSLFVEIIDDLGSLADDNDIDLGLVGNCALSLYSDRSSGQCDLSCVKQDHEITIFVEDTGSGLSQEDLTKVFNAFYRVGGDTAKIEGTGLGLSIVKSACDEIGAKIALENRKEGGLRAKVTFKLS